MRLRPRLRRPPAIGPDWVWPHWLERFLRHDTGTVPAGISNESFRNWTTVGTVGSRRVGLVDPRGLVTVSRGWSLDWWVGAEDRWHVPAREPAVRQSLVSETPVVETVMRVPSGDAAHRVFAVAGEPPMVVIEVTNRSPLPFAVAFAVRPYDVAGLGRVRRIDYHDRAVTVDGTPAVVFPALPRGVAGSTAAAGDSAVHVFGGETGEWPPGLHCPDGGAQAAFLFPVAHRATVRMALPLVDGRPPFAADAWAAALPSSDAAVRGWQAQTSTAGMRFALPEGRLAAAVEANRRHLLLLEHAAPVVKARRRSAAARDGVRPSALLGQAAKALAAGDRRCLVLLDRVLDLATPTWTWPDVVDARTGGGVAGDGHSAAVAAGLVALVRDFLVRETADGVALCSMIPEPWLGHPIDVYDVMTRHGPVSWALRWHGERPALLWQLPSAADRTVRVTAPGLDPEWSSYQARGEALLAPRLATAATGGSFS